MTPGRWSSLRCCCRGTKKCIRSWYLYRLLQWRGVSQSELLLLGSLQCQTVESSGSCLVLHTCRRGGPIRAGLATCSRGCRVGRVAKKVKVGRAGVRRDPDWPVTSCSPSHWSLVDALSMPILEPSDALPVRGSGYFAECEQITF